LRFIAHGRKPAVVRGISGCLGPRGCSKTVERQSEIWRICLENYCDKSEWHLKGPITHESIIATRDEIRVWMYHSLYEASLLSVLPLCRIQRSTDFRREEIYFDNDRRDV